jgi:hypothetical protein
VHQQEDGWMDGWLGTRYRTYLLVGETVSRRGHAPKCFLHDHACFASVKKELNQYPSDAIFCRSARAEHTRADHGGDVIAPVRLRRSFRAIRIHPCLEEAIVLVSLPELTH